MTAVDSSASDAPLPVLIFYDGYELKAREALAPRLYHRARCFARAVWRRAKGKQVNTGFYVAFLALVDGLRQLGCEVRINDFAAARARPDHPIGLAGYPSVLDEVDLPNPVIFGPGDPGYPDTAGAWAAQPKVRFVIQPSPWFVDYYRPFCGDKMLCCPVGIDTAALPDLAGVPKSIDVLIYDKIRWDRDTLVDAGAGLRGGDGDERPRLRLGGRQADRPSAAAVRRARPRRQQRALFRRDVRHHLHAGHDGGAVRTVLEWAAAVPAARLCRTHAPAARHGACL